MKGKHIITRILSIMLSVIMAGSLILDTGVHVVNAAETITTLHHTKKIIPDGFVVNGKTHTGMYMWSTNNQWVYCLSPGLHAENGNKLTLKYDDFVLDGTGKINSKRGQIKISKEKRKLLSMALRYGYQGTVTDNPGKEAIGKYAATQQIVWWILDGALDDSSFVMDDELAKEAGTLKAATDDNDIVKAYTAEIHTIFPKVRAYYINLSKYSGKENNFGYPNFLYQYQSDAEFGKIKLPEKTGSDGTKYYGITIDDEEMYTDYTSQNYYLGDQWNFANYEIVAGGITKNEITVKYDTANHRLVLRSSRPIKTKVTIKVYPKINSGLMEMLAADSSTSTVYTNNTGDDHQDFIAGTPGGLLTPEGYLSFWAEHIPEDTPKPTEDITTRSISTASKGWNVEITKTDRTTGNTLSGVTYDVYCDGSWAGSVTTDYSGYASYTGAGALGSTATYITPESWAKYHDVQAHPENYEEGTLEKLEMQIRLLRRNGAFDSYEEAYASLAIPESAQVDDSQVDEYGNPVLQIIETHDISIVETGTRQGYVLHGYAPDDEPIYSQTVMSGGTVYFGVTDQPQYLKLHLSKEDIETGNTPQGDATFAGAVYGLYTKEDIYHPDGKTGRLYDAGDLCAIQTTGEDGSLVYDQYTVGSYEGKNLFPGNYEIREIVRSEGYELSVTGSLMKDTNYGSNSTIVVSQGRAEISKFDMNGTPNELLFNVSAEGLDKGYDVGLLGLPQGSQIYRVTESSSESTETVLSGYTYEQLKDDDGNLVWQMAEDGEYKLDADGNYIAKVEGGNTVYSSTPEKETYGYFEYDGTDTSDEMLAELENKTCIYYSAEDKVVIKKKDDGQKYEIEYASGEFELYEDGGVVTVDKRERDADDNIVTVYVPEWDTYSEGDCRLDGNGNQIPVMGYVAKYEDKTVTNVTENRIPVDAEYNAENGMYQFSVDVTGSTNDSYVIVMPEDCSSLDYESIVSAYACAHCETEESESGSYVLTVIEPYAGPYISLRQGSYVAKERIIKQKLQIYKTIAKDSYTYNTYDIQEKDTQKGFVFRVYLVSNLIDHGLELGGDGEYDYTGFFRKHPDYEKDLACTVDSENTDGDNDQTTITARTNLNSSYWYGTTDYLPYGRYVIVEQQPTEMPMKQYAVQAPAEVSIPSIPEEGENKDTLSTRYYYDQNMSLEDMQSRFNIRLGEEYDSQYGSGETVLNVDRSSLKNTTLADYHNSYLAALVPWSVLAPKRIQLEGTWYTQDEDYDSYVGNAYKNEENTLYSTKLRIEKLDGDTGENILVDGAIFKLYKAKRDADGNVVFDENDCPVYDENDIVTMVNEKGAFVGEYKAVSTTHEVVTKDNESKVVTTGYVETPQPIGAGTYVLVETKAPAGYVKLAKPVAIEIYSDKVSYYPNGKNSKTVAKTYQYTDNTTFTKTVDMSVINVNNSVTRILVNKVQAGERTITYKVFGSETEMLARKAKEGDTVELAYDEEGLYKGYAEITHTYDEWSGTKVEGTEKELATMPNVLPVYDEEGVFQGYGIRYDIYIGNAELTVYNGQKLNKKEDGTFDVEVTHDGNGKVTKITAANTGTASSVEKTGEKDRVYDVYNQVDKENPPASLLFYDLDEVKTETKDGILYLLDERGNRTCMLDKNTGLAYVKDAEKNCIAYVLNEKNEKTISQKLDETVNADGSKTIYENVSTVDDENGLPVYYETLGIVSSAAIWTTSGQNGYEITRLPIGTYIIEETKVPYDQGFIQAQPIGMTVKETEKIQGVNMLDDFTKIELSKQDITTCEEIEGAKITVYKAEKDENGNVTKGEVYETWTSGEKPHWIDHIPVGDYIMEETIVPVEDGYVHAESIRFTVSETGEVQGQVMKDDYTKVVIKKTDSFDKSKVVSGAELTLYTAQADLEKDAYGVPVLDSEKVRKNEDGTPVTGTKLLTWVTGQEKEGTLAGVKDESGKDIAGNAKYKVSADGSIEFTYLPVGFYVVKETKTPFGQGYTTAATQLIYASSNGQTKVIDSFDMEDAPTTLEISKTAITGGNEIKGAKLSIYKATDEGTAYGEAVEEWISETKPHVIRYLPVGKYVLHEEQAPHGVLIASDIAFELKDTGEVQKVEMIDEIPTGSLNIYKYDGNQSGSVTIAEFKKQIEQQKTSGGPIAVSGASIKALAGAEFTITNTEENKVVGTLTTDQYGFAGIADLPAGYIAEDGTYKPYHYSVKETKAPAGFTTAHERTINFEVKDGEKTTTIDYLCSNTRPTSGGGGGYTPSVISYQATVNKVGVSASGTGVIGAKLRVKDASGNIIDSWTSTGDPHCILNIYPGTYTLEETEAPEGYKTAEPVTFTVSGNTEVTMQDKETETKFIKLDAETDDAVTGAELALYEGNSLLSTWVTDGSPHTELCLVPGKTYTLKEISAPEGYVLAEDITFTRGENDVEEVTMKDEAVRGYISIHKTDKETGEDLAGAEFKLYDEYGNLLETLVTDENGDAVSEYYRIGEVTDGKFCAYTFTFHESKAPKGYNKPDKEYDVIFEYVDDTTPVVTLDYEITNSKHRPKPETPSDKPKEKVKQIFDKLLPQTGDWYSPVWFILAGALFVGIGVMVNRRRKKSLFNEDDFNL